MCLWTFQKTPRPFKLGSCIDWNVYIKTTPFSCDSIFCILCYRPHVLKPHVPDKTHFVGLSCGCIVAIKWFSKQKTKQELSRKIENNDILEPFLSSLEDWIWILWSFLIYWFFFQEEKKKWKRTLDRIVVVILLWKNLLNQYFNVPKDWIICTYQSEQTKNKGDMSESRCGFLRSHK